MTRITWDTRCVAICRRDQTVAFSPACFPSQYAGSARSVDALVCESIPVLPVRTVRARLAQRVVDAFLVGTAEESLRHGQALGAVLLNERQELPGDVLRRYTRHTQVFGRDARPSLSRKPVCDGYSASPSVNHLRIGAGSACSCSMMLQTTFEALVLSGSYGRKGAPALSRIPWRSEATSGLDPRSGDRQHSARRTASAGRTSRSQRCGHLDAARHARDVRVDLEVDTPGASISRSTAFGETWLASLRPE